MAVILLLLTLQSIPSVALTGTLHSPRVKESSGIAASRAHPGVLWTHNDSGDDGICVQEEAIDFLDDPTFVVTSEADRRGRGSIHTVRCPE